MTAVAYDTLKFARTLRETAQMITEQAEGLAVAIAEAVQGDMATKGDVVAARADIRTAELRLLAKIEAAETETIKGGSRRSAFRR